jgi:hypothetical protein
MGVNKNISILMLFDCVRVNTNLGFHWICYRKKEKKRGGGYVNWWWYQSWTIFLYYACWSFLIGENISIWSSSFRFESSCSRDGEMWWIILQRKGPYLVVGGVGNFFYHESYWDESVIMTIYGFQNFCDVSSGVGLCPCMAYGRGEPLYGSLHPSTGFWGA